MLKIGILQCRVSIFFIYLSKNIIFISLCKLCNFPLLSLTMEIYLFTDWASRWNPWESWWGFIGYNKEKEVLFTWSKYFWTRTNNQSEYLALVEWIKKALEFNPKVINIFMDSELIIKQLKWEYRVKNKDLKPFYIEVVDLLSGTKWTAKHVERKLNKDADMLANIAVDRKI